MMALPYTLDVIIDTVMFITQCDCIIITRDCIIATRDYIIHPLPYRMHNGYTAVMLILCCWAVLYT